MFGGRCAYCGTFLDGKWHLDHVEPVERESKPVKNANGIGYETTKAGFTMFRATGKLRKPENDTIANLFPSCVRCNRLKSNANVEAFRDMLVYFAASIPHIPTYTHVHHLMRFGKLTIDPTPVVFWFERYREQARA
jgi:5-methylcytosine-specific restriction endonuclease McrA